MATRIRPAGRPEAATQLIGPPGEPPEPPPRRELWSWLLVVFLLVVAGLAAAWYASRGSGHDSSARVAPATTVVAAATRARARVQPRETAKTAVQVDVPDVVGQERNDAVRALEAQDLRARVHGVPSDQEEGVVVAQAPRGGSRVDKGSSVAINVSTGPAEPVPGTVDVPDVVGQSKDEAKDAIEAAGLEPSTEDVPSLQPRETVVSQSPGGGTRARPGSQVLIGVSAGPPTPTGKAKGKGKGGVKAGKHERPERPGSASVPRVVGEDEATASADLRDAGFSVSTVDQPTGDTSQDGVVVDQSPSGGSSAEASSTVTIFVGRYDGDRASRHR